MRSLRPISERKDDAEDELELKYMTRIYLSHLHRNSFTTLWLQEPKRSTWQQLDTVVWIVLPTPCKRFWENFGMRCRQDDAEDDGGNELKYCGQLSHCSLLRPISGCQDDAEDDLELQYVTIIYLCHLHKNSCTTLWLQEPTQSTCHQLDSVVSIVLPTPCKRFGENFGMILFWGAPMSRR